MKTHLCSLCLLVGWTLCAQHYPPMPLPMLPKMVEDAPVDTFSQAILYDIATQHHEILQLPTPHTKVTEVPALSYPLPPELLEWEKRFSSLSLRPNTTRFPERTTVKLRMNFGGRLSSCSGVLVAPDLVLTAGHCLYNHSPSQSFVQSVEVIPAYSNGDQPYGSAYGTQIIYFNGWVNSHDYNWDIMMLKLDRPIGVRTGWLGFGYNNDGHHFRDNTFHNLSYPGALPFKGEELYLQSGRFDDINRHIVYYDGLAYPGMSGSDMYYKRTATNRVVNAILSHGLNNRTGSTRINDDKFDTFLDNYENAQASNRDLIPHAVQLNGVDAQAGFVMPATTLGIFNYSKRNFSGRVKAEAFLSPDPYSGGNDITAAYFNIPNVRMDDMNFHTVEASPSSAWTIPAQTPAGWYYLGVKIVDSDDVTHNNTIPGKLTTRIYVEKAPYCSGDRVLPALEGVISDDSGTDTYANRSNCRWVIAPEVATAFIHLNFTAVDLGAGDQLSIQEEVNGQWSPVATYTQETPPPGYLFSKASRLAIHFRADQAEVGDGFMINYTCTPSKPNEIQCLDIFPNPSAGKAYLSCATAQPVSFELFTISGQQTTVKGHVDENGNAIVDMSKLPRGTYLLKLHFENEVQVKRVLKR